MNETPRSYTITWSSGLSKKVLLTKKEFSDLAGAWSEGKARFVVEGVGLVALDSVKLIVDNESQLGRMTGILQDEKRARQERAEQRRVDAHELVRRAGGR